MGGTMGNRPRRRGLGTAGTLLLVAFAAACGGGGTGGGSGSEEAVRYGFDFELNLSDTFDPQQSLSTCDRLALEWIYGTLTSLDESGAPQPGLAESWEIDDAAGTMTLTLREGLEFSDGTPFDAEAVAAGLEYLKTGEQVSEGLTAMDVGRSGRRHDRPDQPGRTGVQPALQPGREQKG